MNEQQYQKQRDIIRILVRAREDFQGMRKRMDNRIGRKADGDEQDREKLPAREFEPEDAMQFSEIADEARKQEAAIEKKLLAACKAMPAYPWLKSVKGVGTIAMGHILGWIDIYKATTVSKIWQYAGMNPGMVIAKKRVENKDGTFSAVPTTALIRGDRLAPGYIAPFNKQLRTALLGVMGDGFIKAQNTYCMEHYYPVKARLEQSDNTVEEVKKAGAKAAPVAWKDAKKAHRHRAAIRKMVKAFLQDFYVAARTAHGLPVRPPYAEEYLGKVHQA